VFKLKTFSTFVGRKRKSCFITMTREDLWPIISISFLVGAASATVFCWTIFRKHVDEEDLRQEWLRRLEVVRSRAENTKWPWDSMIRRSANDSDESKYSDTETYDQILKTPVRMQDKSGLCIGSIFGMDAGGTLTKLVYFEQRSNELLNATTELEDKVDKHIYHRRTTTVDVLTPMKKSVEKGNETYQRAGSLPIIGGVHTSADIGSSFTEDASPLKPRIVFELSKSRDHAEALDSFYNFARGFSRFQSGVRDEHLTFYSKELGGDFHFIQFETRQMESAMDLIRAHKLHSNICEMGATGGGAHKYADAWDRVLGIKIRKEDELNSLVAGMQFVLSTVIGECYTFRPRIRKVETNEAAASSQDNEESDSEEGNDQNECEKKGDEWWWSRKIKRDSISPSSTYPYLLVMIGTGVSVLRVDGPRRHVRVSGSTIGGGTFWGLIRLLTDIDDFQTVLKMAEKGDSSKADMMVGDIYGRDSKALEKIGLPSNLVASSFGKLVAKSNPAAGLSQEDLARALLLMVTNNIGQVAYLNARLSKTPSIYFVGNFLRNNKISQRRLAYAINYWSKGEMEALFLEHEGYLGALGAFLLSQEISQTDKGFFQRNKRDNSKNHVQEQYHS
jgi:type II pantothenate kinase